jgi:hypothetical protein
MAFNIIKILSTIVAGRRPSGHTYGEPYVNFTDNQFGVIDSGNNVHDLLGVPFFSSGATYAANNPVNYSGQLYSAKAAVPAGVWNPAQWNVIGGGVPVGSTMLFWQAAAPTGWTQVTTHNDKALRVVSGTGGVAGGTNAFSTVMAQTVVGNTTLSTTTMATHTHPITTSYDLVAATYLGGGSAGYGTGSSDVQHIFTSFAISNAGGGSPHNHGITMDIQYIDIILATKN